MHEAAIHNIKHTAAALDGQPLLWAKIAALALLFAAVMLLPARRAEAQTQPVSPDDSLYISVDADRWTVCGVSKAGYVRCRGDVLSAPLRSETAGYVQVAVSRLVTCGRKSDGSVKCWAGSSTRIPTIPTFDPDGTPGNGDERPYTFSDIRAGQSHGCGLTNGANGQTAGKLLCWSAGSVPAGSNPDKLSTVPDGSGTLSLIPANTGGDVDFTALTFSHLASGNQSNCALISSAGSDNGKPRCWSIWSSSGNAGVAEPDVPLSAIAIGDEDPACGIVAQDTTVGGTTYTAGQIVCWGLNFENIVSAAPTAGTYTALAVGDDHACAVSAAGSITCWGEGGSSNISGNHGQMSVPAELAGATFAAVYASAFVTCGLLDGRNNQTAGTLRCWGEQNVRTLYPSDPALHSWGAAVSYEERPGVPLLATVPDAMDVNRHHSCALTAAGDAACWGNAYYDYPPPAGVKGVATAFQSACFIRKGGGDDDGKVFCVGANGRGQASGTSARSDAMTADLNALRFSRIYAGIWHYCGIIDDRDASDGDDSGKVRCWGFNDQDQSKAPGQTAAQNQSPSQSKTITDLGTNTYAKITAGFRYTCGLLASGRIVCWGNQTSPASTAHQIPAALQSKTFSDIDAGWWHQTCAIEDGQNNQTAGKLHCWGNNPTIGGQTIPLGSVPAELQNLTFKKVSAGREHNCALTTAGRAVCWGYGAQGRSPVPSRYNNIRFVDIDAGHYHTCGVTDRGRALCWGADGDLATAGVQVALASGGLVNFGQADPPPQTQQLRDDDPAQSRRPGPAPGRGGGGSSGSSGSDGCLEAVCIVAHPATPIQLCTDANVAGFRIYFIGADGSATPGPFIVTPSPGLPATQLYTGTNPLTGKTVTVDWLTDGPERFRVSAYYPDNEYDVDKPYVFTVDRDCAVVHIIW